ncbi:MAG: HNH/ENDO VII family nuclease [Clostridia bacterium]|nr:HNH/ENDO VII family nuclease [Clostridia bacterium]
MLKRLLSLVLALSLLCSACYAESADTVPDFKGMNDPALLPYIEDTLYQELVGSLNSDEYFVENVSAIYISQEYLDELAFNSQANIFFGYTLAELDEQFQGMKYVFTLGKNNETVVEPFEAYDDTYDRVLQNVAVGTGVILICVTVSVVTAGAGAPAVSLIFAAAAKSGTVMALSGGVLGGVSAGVVTGIQTGDMDAAIKSAALAGSEGFKWGAITGAISGGASEAIALKGATLNGLTMNEAAAIQKESGFPLDVIKNFKSIDQYNICKEAGLTPQMVNGKMSLIRSIDLNFKDELGKTNLQRMREGLAALDPSTRQAYQLHHIGQEMDSTLAILTEAEHMQNGNNLIWHVLGSDSAINRTVFDKQRQAYWKTLAEILFAGGV